MLRKILIQTRKRETPVGVQARGDPADARLIEEAPGLPAASEQLKCRSSRRLMISKSHIE
jgi:hypothetical protein